MTFTYTPGQTEEQSRRKWVNQLEIIQRWEASEGWAWLSNYLDEEIKMVTKSLNQIERPEFTGEHAIKVMSALAVLTRIRNLPETQTMALSEALAQRNK